MQKLLNKRLLYSGAGWLTLAIFSVNQAVAQTAGRPDSLAVVAAVAAATQRYTEMVRPESVLFNGPEYVNYSQAGTIGHQFFLEPTPQKGTLTYRSAYFEAVPLSYDLVLDQVVMTYPGQAATVTLVPDHLTTFSLGSHQFMRVRADSATGSVLPTGYYEVLQAGPVSLLARHTKRIHQTTVQQNLRLEYQQTDQLIVRTASAAAEVTSLKNLLALLPQHKPEVQRYAHQQGLRFSSAQREASALSVLRYYYSLPQ